jgi:hypothetical protein
MLSVVFKFFKAFDLSHTYTVTWSEAPCSYSGVGTEYFSEEHDRKVSLSEERALESILVKQYNSISYNYYETNIHPWECECDFFWESYKHSKKGKTQQEALLNLCIDRKKDIYDAVKEMFKDK